MQYMLHREDLKSSLDSEESEKTRQKLRNLKQKQVEDDQTANLSLEENRDDFTETR